MSMTLQVLLSCVILLALNSKVEVLNQDGGRKGPRMNENAVLQCYCLSWERLGTD